MNLKVFTCNNENEFVDRANRWCREKIETTQSHSMFLPAGNSGKLLYKLWRETSPSFLHGMEFMQVDEVIEGDKKNLFRQFFEQELPQYKVTPVEAERQPAPLAILGVGINGHVAFHEPGYPKSMVKEVVQLSESTCSDLGVNPGTHALTYGTGAFLKAQAILLLFRGEKKRPLLERFAQTAEPLLPFEYLKTHPDLTVLVWL